MFLRARTALVTMATSMKANSSSRSGPVEAEHVAGEAPHALRGDAGGDGGGHDGEHVLDRARHDVPHEGLRRSPAQRPQQPYRQDQGDEAAHRDHHGGDEVVLRPGADVGDQVGDRLDHGDHRSRPSCICR
ncbi:hypothetical protein ACIBH1_44530 [Nonomuraea sp. NPDC050663]|uniref:hypothetical protein n=1 Tax=Nonomuraea sp. NPDC050663 TaxID=3364370 RepID=UPI0037BBE329